MNKIITLSMVLFIAAPLSAQTKAAKTLSDVAQKIDSYKGKRLTLVLKLKQYSLPRFMPWSIEFYDSKNHDIRFYISDYYEKKRIARFFKGLHEGLRYYVTFKVQKLGSNGLIIGELQSFQPVVKKILP